MDGWPANTNEQQLERIRQRARRLQLSQVGASNNQSTTKLYPALQGQAIVFEISKHWRSHCF
jgi:hypothetical protein